ncbi:MAG: DMT family transporter [Candidatus Bathyarchaeia archaeon]
MLMVSKHSSARKLNSFSLVDIMLVCMSFIWGLNFVVIKTALNYFTPLSFNALRFSIASFLLLIFLKFREKNFWIRKNDLKNFLLLALIGNTIYQILFINGIFLTTAGNSSIILATTPIIVALLSSILGIEKIEYRTWQGVFISFAGVALITLGSNRPITLTTKSLIGDLLIIACTICWSTYTVLSKPLLKYYSPLKLVSLTVAIGTLPLVVASTPSLITQNWSYIPAEAWLSLIYSAILAVALGYAIWYTGVNHIGSAKTAIYEYLITVIAITAAWILLNETLNPIQITGAALVFAGLFRSRK